MNKAQSPLSQPTTMLLPKLNRCWFQMVESSLKPKRPKTRNFSPKRIWVLKGIKKLDSKSVFWSLNRYFGFLSQPCFVFFEIWIFFKTSCHFVKIFYKMSGHTAQYWLTQKKYLLPYPDLSTSLSKFFSIFSKKLS